MVNRSVRKHHRGGDFSQTTTATPSESTSTMQVVQKKATGILDTIKEYASNIKNKASDYMNKATTGGRGTKKLRKPTKGTKQLRKPRPLFYKKKTYRRRTHHKRK